MKTTSSWILVVFTAFLLTGCGLKGPLVMPPAQDTTTATATPEVHTPQDDNQSPQ